MLKVFVPGIAAAQGSKRFLGTRGGKGVMVESSAKVKPWRSDVRAALLDADGQPKMRFDGPVALWADFILPRPKSAPKRKPASAVKVPDLSKLIRAVEDAITSAGVWRDDCQVVQCHCDKRVAEPGETPGCLLRIFDYEELQVVMPGTAQEAA